MRQQGVTSWNGVDNLELKQNQLEVHQLKVVCKQFRDIHATYEGLVQQLYISSIFPVRSLLSLLAWLQQNKGSVQSFRAMNDSSLDAVLTGLVTSEQCMKVVDIAGVSACSISLVAAFTKLEKCAIMHESAGVLDLKPLAVLPNLSQLFLNGKFQQLHHLAGLTHLVCTASVVSETGELVSTLQHLEIDDSDLVGMHALGLSSCTALTQLVLKNAFMGDNNDVYFDPSLTQVPASIGLLSQLHTLVLSSARAPKYGADLDWVSELMSLQNLSMSFGCSSLRNIIQHVSLLTKLTCGKVSGPEPFSELPVANFDIEWHRLQALQELSICQVELQIGQGFASLSQLPCLRQISLVGSSFHSERDGGYFAALMHVLARLRPQVKLVCDVKS